MVKDLLKKELGQKDRLNFFHTYVNVVFGIWVSAVSFGHWWQSSWPVFLLATMTVNFGLVSPDYLIIKLALGMMFRKMKRFCYLLIDFTLKISSSYPVIFNPGDLTFWFTCTFNSLHRFHLISMIHRRKDDSLEYTLVCVYMPWIIDKNCNQAGVNVHIHRHTDTCTFLSVYIPGLFSYFIDLNILISFDYHRIRFLCLHSYKLIVCFQYFSPLKVINNNWDKHPSISIPVN